jgi:hypothetical protein
MYFRIERNLMEFKRFRVALIKSFTIPCIHDTFILEIKLALQSTQKHNILFISGRCPHIVISNKLYSYRIALAASNNESTFTFTCTCTLFVLKQAFAAMKQYPPKMHNTSLVNKKS